jgi:hypothetical protein
LRVVVTRDTLHTGSGASGTVYRGFYHEHEVAIKELKEDDDGKAKERLDEFKKVRCVRARADLVR